MDIFDNSTLRYKCLQTYGELETSNTSGTTIFCIAALPLLAFGLEFVAHWRIVCDPAKRKEDEEEAARLAAESPEASAIPMTETVSEQPQREAEPQAEPQPTVDNDGPKDAKAKPEEKKSDPSCTTCCVDSPSPHVRANRLLAASFLYGLVLTAFILRIRELNTEPDIDALCRDVIHPTPSNWAVLAIFIFFPFMSASISFLRTVIDSVLVRWGRALRMDATERDKTCFWPPCVSLMVVALFVYLVVEAFKVPIACLMGDREVSEWTKRRSKKGKERAEDVEMQGEEAQGLVENVDGPREEGKDAEEPPAYDEVISTRVSVEGKPPVDV